MTGMEFKKALAAAGYSQAAFARAMGVHRETIGNQCNAAHVEKYWASALAGQVGIKNAKLILKNAKLIISLVGKVDI